MTWFGNVKSIDLRKWNSKCPGCGGEIRFRLYDGKLGATSNASCSNNINSTRMFTRDELDEGKLKVCDWEGYAVRMWDGSVRFKNKNGRFLFEWRVEE
jgi:hypothetical protein|tara:strand:+ start:153 stop:446 length:294 start_codon:yes stop_codon:yes gene_type:complete